MADFYARYLDTAFEALRAVQVTDRDGAALDVEPALQALCRRTLIARTDDRSLYFCGNGASAGMASHMCVDWLKNGGIRASVFTDPATVTAYANDTGYDNVFAGPLRRLARPGDMLVSISSSGASPNVVRAVHAAREIDLFVVTLTGFDPANPTRAIGDLNFYVPARTYGITESAHQLILHAWFDCFMAGQP